MKAKWKQHNAPADHGEVADLVDLGSAAYLEAGCRGPLLGGHRTPNANSLPSAPASAAFAWWPVR